MAKLIKKDFIKKNTPQVWDTNVWVGSTEEQDKYFLKVKKKSI